jgi:hypothetical protein
MLLDTLNALNQAGIEALQSTCGLRVQGREVSLVREGRRSFPSLVTLRIKGCPLQMVHLGCDTHLAGKLAELSPGPDGGSGLDVLAGSFLSHLLEKFDDRNPRGTVEKLQAAPITLHTRGVRTFQFRLDTGQGQLSFLAEVPSRAEMAIAKDSDFLTSMESIYLPGDWHGEKDITDPEAVDNFLNFLRKTEGDIYLEAPAGDGTATLNSGLLVEIGRAEDRPVLKLITDFADPALGVPAPGAAVKACVGIGDRSLEFGETSPWSDGEFVSEVIFGRLADLSFSGARIIADHSQLCSCFQKDGRVVCRMHFPDMDEPLQVMGVIRRSTACPADRNQWQDEIGIEFLIFPGGDRTGLDFIRQFVLEVQRSKLTQRLQVSGT